MRPLRDNTRHRTKRRGAGFTLLEVMIAMAILSGALVWLIVGVTRNIKAENHAKLITTATFLARGRMVELQDELYDKGFGEFEKEQTGQFEDKGFARFSWRTIVDKVELPSVEQLQTVLSNAQTARQSLAGGSTDPSLANQAGLNANNPLGGAGSTGNPLSAGAGALSSQFGVIKEVLEQAIRRVTVKVSWTELHSPQEVEVVAYYVDVRRVDQAIQIGSAAAAGGQSPGGGGAPGAGGTTTSPPTTGAPR